jgi:hypothetical protein
MGNPSEFFPNDIWFRGERAMLVPFSFSLCAQARKEMWKNVARLKNDYVYNQSKKRLDK